MDEMGFLVNLTTHPAPACMCNIAIHQKIPRTAPLTSSWHIDASNAATAAYRMMHYSLKPFIPGLSVMLMHQFAAIAAHRMMQQCCDARLIILWLLHCAWISVQLT